jgi:glutamine cyclotransferase
VYANVYLTDKIVKIDYSNGKIVETYTLDHIVKKEPQAKMDEVLNGIAYNAKSK